MYIYIYTHIYMTRRVFSLGEDKHVKQIITHPNIYIYTYMYTCMTLCVCHNLFDVFFFLLFFVFLV